MSTRAQLATCNSRCNSESTFGDLPLIAFPRGTRCGKDRSMESKTRRVAVLGGNRIPFARSNTVYATTSNQEMLTAAIDGLVTRFGLQGQRVGEVVAGAVLKHSRDFNLARESVLGSKLAAETPATDIQQACGTGLQAAIQVANKIALGQIDVGIAGGTDTTSDAPIAVNEKLRKILLEPEPRQGPQGPPRRAGEGPSGRHRPVDPAERRAAHRPVDGGPRRADRPRSGRSAARSRTSSPPRRTSTSPRRTTPGSSTTRSPRSAGSSVTRTCAPTPRSRSSPSSSRSSARARPPR